MIPNTEIKTLKAHLALNVRSAENSIEFYRRMLGIEPSKVRTGYAKFDVQNPPLNLTLNENSFGDRGSLSHLGIQVASTEDVLATKVRWQAAGLETFDEMGTNCCYALQDKSWVKDPDGNEWEVFVVLEDNLAETSMCCVTEGAAGENETEVVAGAACAAPAARAEEKSAASCCAPAASQISINSSVEKSCC